MLYNAQNYWVFELCPSSGTGQWTKFENTVITAVNPYHLNDTLL
jgi:hypothetical protein